MATSEVFFPQNMATLAYFFPKKSCVQLALDFTCQCKNTGAGSKALTGKLKIFLHISKFTRL
jgi:hypothetical protein